MEQVGVLRDMALFVEVARRRSFSQASTALAMPLSSLSRRIAALETAMGLKLIERTTRRFALTSSGDFYYKQASRIVEDANAAYDEMLALAHGLSGSLTIAAPSDPWVLSRLGNLVAEFQETHRDVRVHIDVRPIGDSTVTDCDLAFSLREPKDNSLISRRIAEFENGLYATRSYLDREGPLSHPRDLLGRECLARMDAGTSAVTWTLRRNGETATIPVAGAISATDRTLLVELVRRDHGITALSIDVGRSFPDLVQVLPDWRPPATPIHVVTTSRLLSARARSFVEFAWRRLQGTSASPADAAKRATLKASLSA